MKKPEISYQDYATKVAEILDFPSVERLESCYGDMILDCYELGDTVGDCVRFCRYDDEEYMGTDESRFND